MATSSRCQTDDDTSTPKVVCCCCCHYCYHRHQTMVSFSKAWHILHPTQCYETNIGISTMTNAIPIESALLLKVSYPNIYSNAMHWIVRSLILFMRWLSWRLLLILYVICHLYRRTIITTLHVIQYTRLWIHTNSRTHHKMLVANCQGNKFIIVRTNHHECRGTNCCGIIVHNNGLFGWSFVYLMRGECWNDA